MGTLERAAKSKHAGERSVANQPHRALSTREPPALADADAGEFGDGTFRGRRTLFDTLANGGALFFTELVRRSGLLASEVEDALAQLAALGLVIQIVSMGCELFWCRPISGPRLAVTSGNGGGKRILPASSSQGVGRC